MLRFYGVPLIAVLLGACGSTATPAADRPVLVPTQPAPTSMLVAPPVVSAPSIAAADPRALGDPQAPVTIVEYSDYACPFCAAFVRETRPQLVRDYVDTGKVRLVFRDFPLPIHPSATLAAVAGRCAAAQDQFWPMHEHLFATHGTAWGGDPVADRVAMTTFAQDLGLDGAAFEQCVDDPATRAAVQTEAQTAYQHGVNSTPNFVVNTTLVRGALPFTTFQRLITQELAAVR